MWDFSLVDPDNRRPVDFALRSQDSRRNCARARNRTIRLDSAGSCCANYRDGRIKLWATMCALNFRRDHKELFQRVATFLCRDARQRRARCCLCAFAPRRGGDYRCAAAKLHADERQRRAAAGRPWGDSELPLPAEVIRQAVAQHLHWRGIHAGAVDLMPRNLRQLSPGSPDVRVEGCFTQASRSVISTRSAIFLASSGVRAPGCSRHDQFPAVLLGTFIRASLSRPSTS